MAEERRMSLVQMRISAFGLLERLLLPEGTTLAGAGIECRTTLPSGADVLVLTLEMPDVPEGAVSVDLEYAHSGHRDPVELTGMRWLRADGSEIKTAPKDGQDESPDS